MEDDLMAVTAVAVEPNQCPLQAPLLITVHYALKRPLAAVAWQLVYEADYTNKRHAIQLFRGPSVDMPAGPGVFTHHVPIVQTEGVKEKLLLQMGVLRLVLAQDGNPEPLVSVNMVTTVSKDASGTLIRDIMSPLE